MTEYILGNYTFTLFSVPSDFIQVCSNNQVKVMPKTQARVLYQSLLNSGLKPSQPISYQGMGNVLLGKHW